MLCDPRIFSCIRRLGPSFWVQHFELHYFGGFQKNEYSFGMKILWIAYVLGPITKLDYIEGSFLCILGTLFKVKVQNLGYFLVSENSKYFVGCLKFLTFLFFLGGGEGGLNGRCWARANV